MKITESILVFIGMSLMAACMFGATCVGILKEQELREYKISHQREYRQWMCDVAVNNYALEKGNNE